MLNHKAIAARLGVVVLFSISIHAEAAPPPAPPPDKFFPVTAGEIDTSFWFQEPKTEFKKCFGLWAAKNPKEAEEKALRDERIRYCTFEVSQAHDEICEDPDTEMCSRLDYFQSWCGRLELAEQNNPEWECFEQLSKSFDTFASRDDVNKDRVSLPDTLYNYDGESTHYLEAVDAYVRKDNATYEDSAFGETELQRSKKRQRWQSNKKEVASCEEYAHESFYDFSRLVDATRASRRDPQQVMKAIFTGIGTVGPFVDSAGNLDLRDRSNDPIPNQYDTSTTTSGFGKNPLSSQRKGYDRNLFDYVSTKQYRIDELRSTPAKFLVEWRAPRTDVDLLGDLSWHKNMAAQQESEHFLADDLEKLQQRQAELESAIEYYTRALAAAAMDSALEDEASAAWQDILDRLDYGSLHGCGTGGASACDWAPSTFVDPLFRFYEQNQQVTRSTCESILGTSKFTEIKLHNLFFDASLLVSGTALDELVVMRNNFLATSPTKDTHGVRQFLTDIKRYREAVYERLPQAPGKSATRQTHAFQKSGGKAGFLELDISSFSSSGITPKNPTAVSDAVSDTVCERSDDCEDFEHEDVPGFADCMNDICVWIATGEDGSDAEGEVGDPICENELYSDSVMDLQISVFGNPLNIFKVVEWFEDGAPVDYVEGEEFTSVRKGELNGSINVGGQLIHEPCFSNGGVRSECSGLGGMVSVSLDVGLGIGYSQFIPAGNVPVGVLLGAGIEASIGGGLSMGVKSVVVHPSGSIDPFRTDCPDPIRTTLSVSLAPHAGVDMFASAGVGVGYPGANITVGIKGSVQVMQGSLPIVGSITWDTSTSDLVYSLYQDLAFSALRGGISLFAQVQAAFVNITVAEVELFRTAAFEFTVPLWGVSHSDADGTTGEFLDEDRRNFCVLSELNFGIFCGMRRTAAGCTCILNDDSDCESGVLADELLTCSFPRE